MPDLYNQYSNKMQQLADVKNALAVLQWDQETYMPVKGAASRARQVATLSEIAHKMQTDAQLESLLELLSNAENLAESEQRNVELSIYDMQQQKKLPVTFVRKMSETISASYHSWIEARRQNDFRKFETHLQQLVSLKRQEADYLGYEGHIYNALLNQYEKGATVTMLDNVFGKIQQPLKQLLDKIAAQKQVSDACMHQYFPHQQQWNFGMELLKKMGFDFQAGRQDISEHPFTTNFSSRDVRITTRIDENNFSYMLWSCIHELGHALYEQGLPEKEFGLPLGEYASLSIHESQSRLWENNVGRSEACWQYAYPVLQQYFPEQLKRVSLMDFYKAMNRVEPSLIRTEADELTYHFHVMIRYEIEKNLLEGNIPVKDIPAYWDEQYKKYLGVTVPGDKQGCLQDVHWSHGSFGYFPTYSLGSLYAAQFFNTARQQVDNLITDISKGEFSGLLQWLRENIHQYGRRYESEALCMKLTGEPLNIDYFMQYAQEKYAKIYGV